MSSGEELAAEQRLDPRGIAQEHRGGVLDGFEQVGTALEVGLVAVGGQHLGVGQPGVVGHQREAAVGDGVVGHLLGAGVSGDGVAGAQRAPVARGGPGTASFLLGDSSPS